MADRGPKLTKLQRVFCVKRFAMFDTPSQVVRAVFEEFGLQINRQAAEYYDPTSKAGARMSAEFRAIYDATRKEVTEKMDDIAIAHKTVRLRRLDRMSKRAEDAGNTVHAAALLEQAAKECGGSYSNVRQLTGKDGGPIQTEDVSMMSRPQILDELAKLLTPPGGTPPAIIDRPPTPTPKEAPT